MTHLFPTQKLLDWYDRSARTLPWRKPQGLANPYHVWLSETMLQQTTVKAVIPYFEKFVALWPTIEALAAASLEDINRHWAGLGYYSRAKNLLKCARIITRDYGGHLPQTQKELLKLPGIGPYTSAAIAAIAFGKRTAPVDGNLTRVTARLFAIDTEFDQTKKQVQKILEPIVPASRPGDFAQSLMDMGATICTPKKPDCNNCPLAKNCQALKQGKVLLLPRKKARKKPAKRYAKVYVVYHKDSHSLLLTQRAEKGLLAGLNSFVMQPANGTENMLENIEPAPKFFANTATQWLVLNHTVTHVFTHIRLEMTVHFAIITGHKQPPAPSGTFWVDAAKTPHHSGLPGCMKKVYDAIKPCIERKLF